MRKTNRFFNSYLYNQNPYSYLDNNPFYNSNLPYNINNYYTTSFNNIKKYTRYNSSQNISKLKDYGLQPFIVDIEKVTKENNNFRIALWTGNHLQLTLMSINVGEDIGLEIHPNLDQFIRIEDGEGMVLMGDRKEDLNIKEKVYADFAFIIPAGKWHNLINTGKKPLKLYSIYAPTEHPFGTVHETKAIAEASENHFH